jgi:hypothetical protein
MDLSAWMTAQLTAGSRICSLVVSERSFYRIRAGEGNRFGSKHA